MIDPAVLAYDHDEEALGFEEPPALPDPTPSVGAKISAALTGVGFLVLVALMILDVDEGGLVGTWTGIGASLGLICLGTVGRFWFLYREREPGIANDETWFRSAQGRGAWGWTLAVAITAFYVVLYFYGELQARGMPPLLEKPIRLLDPLARLTQGGESSQWFLYGVLYTLAILVFGVRMLMRYRRNRYQRLRTLSVMFFQLGFAWFLPNLLIAFKQPYMEFNGVWPLKQDYLWPEKVVEQFGAAGTVGMFLFVWAAALVLATPVLTYFFGKRWYCSWVCGCGGLAETLGDPWRQLSDKSTRAWKVERWLIHGVLVAVLAVTISLWIDHATTGAVYGSWSGPLRNLYGLYVVSIFSGVIGVGFYPLMGSRVWCRFGCPQAAILGIWQRLFSRFRITTNGGQCMSCGNCSTYCEMGIDVRAYAQRGENVVRASCVGCGICSAVCPRGVLKLENGLSHADRFAGAESPVGVLGQSLGDTDIAGYAWPAAEPTVPRRTEG